jgi:hypothetical protein
MTFSVQCKALKLPEPVAELRFAPPRKWRFDYAWPEQKLALEVQGGLFSNGRHVRGAALLREYEKLNAAAVRGWRVMFTTPQDMANGNAVLLVEQGLK